jgi:tRNA (adenine37-N6)-methyltransferase
MELKPIGVIHTPYTDKAPYQPVEEGNNIYPPEFSVVIKPEYSKGLSLLNDFHYIYLIYYIHKVKKELSMVVSPPWTGNFKVGLFASRSPVRPNPIGLSVVKIKGIVKNTIFTSGLDVFNGTPLLDIKPYIKNLDSKDDANYGWVDSLSGDKKHMALHIQGIPHDY